MTYAFYVAAALGAVGVYLILPQGRPSPAKLGGVIGTIALGGLLAYLVSALPPATRPGFYYFIFTAIAVLGAVRVITHPRPVYSALYFVLVVLATSGLLVVLQAEFMAFAMVIIYAGAILVTYMFVIMLATMPQSSKEPDASPLYDRSAREPMISTLLGFVLMAVIGSVLFDPAAKPIHRGYPLEAGAAAAADMPRKLDRARVEAALRRTGVIAGDEQITDQNDIDVRRGVIHVSRSTGGARPRTVPLTDEVMNEFVANIDYVGLNLFKGHTLGIELAGVILLLSMVGAVVIARRRVPEAEPGVELQRHTTQPEPRRAGQPAGH